MKLRTLLLFFAISASTVAFAQVDTNAIFRNGDLEISFETEFHNMWDDRGSGSNRNGGFYRPKLDKFQGFHSLGDMAYGGYNPAGQAIAIARDKSVAQDILVAPTDYVFYYNDAGSGANRDGSMWHPTCPAGYVAMGSVANGPSKPSVDAMRCIKEQYVREATLSDNIWDDRGSGGDRSMSAWKIKSPAVNDGDGLIYLSANTFLVSSNYGKPATKAYALIIPMNEKLPADANTPDYPELTSIKEPPLFASNGTTSISYLPWFAVKDNLSLVDRITKSPTYRFERETRYKLVHFLYNGTSSDATQTYSTKVGTNQTKSSSFTTEVGIEVKGGWSSPVGPSAEITLSSKFSHTTGGSTSWTTEEEKSAQVTVKPKTASAVYIIESTYSLYRQDGTQVGIDLGHVPTSSFYVTDYDPSVGIDEAGLENLFSVYPSTSNGEFNVDLKGAFVQDQQEVSVYDLKGALILNQDILSNLTVIDLSGNASGMYIMKVRDGNSVSTKRIILE